MFRVKYTKANSSKKTISKGNQIVLVLNGSSIAKFKNCEFKLKQGDIFYMPDGLAYQVDVEAEYDALKIYLPAECDEMLKGWNDYFININFKENHKYVAKFLKEYQAMPNFDSIQYSTELIKMLKYQKTNINTTPIEDIRVIAVCDYIQQNFERRISLSEIANQIGMNSAYLTTLFKNEIGVPITKYINYIRLESALSEIYYTQYSFTRIAYSNGFADVRTLNAMIKERFNKSPSELREKIKTEVYNHNKYIIVDQYIETYYNYKAEDDSQVMLEINADINTEPTSKVHNNFNCFAIGRAFDILDSEVQSQIKVAANELKFDYCRFHNIFGDEMNCINSHNNVMEFNFVNAIKIFDFLLSHNIKPFVELGFFPSQICNQVEGPFTGYKINVGGEINCELWCELLAEFGRVLINRYGTSEISKWRFEVFNEPDLEAFWANPVADYIEVYKLTYNSLKQVNRSFKIGGFGVSNFSVTNKTVFELNKALFNEEIAIDFLSIHSYPFEVFEFVDYRKLLSNNGVDLIYSHDKLQWDIERAINYANQAKVAEIFITEWNTTVHHREPLNDDMYKASAIVKEFISIADKKISGICCWTLSDVVYELGLNAKEFHGGMGIITQHGIKKSGYQGFYLTNLIKGGIVKQSTNYLITKSSDSIYILIHNNANLKRDYGNTMGSDVCKQIDTKDIICNIKLTNLLADNYQVTTYTVCEDSNPKHVAQLLNINEYLLQAEVEYLKQTSKIKHDKKFIKIEETLEEQLLIENNQAVLIKVETLSKN